MDAAPNAVELTVDHAWFIAETIGAGSFPWVLAITTPYRDAAQRAQFYERQRADLTRMGLVSPDGLINLVVADWKGWDKPTRDAFVKQVAEWETVSKKGDKFSFRAKLLPKYLDRQGDPKMTSATERWMLESYQSVYKKLADERPSALMDKQPAASAPQDGEVGFPADPKHPNIFPKAVVFTSAHLFARRWGLQSYKDRNTGETHSNLMYWWFFPSGRCYMRDIYCLGSTKVKGMEKEILAPTYYLEGTYVHEGWGRYTIDDKDRIQMETDKGEKITMHLVYGRQQVNWGGTVFDGPPKKKK